MSNSLDADQDRHFVGPDICPNVFAKVISRQVTIYLLVATFVVECEQFGHRVFACWLIFHACVVIC